MTSVNMRRGMRQRIRRQLVTFQQMDVIILSEGFRRRERQSIFPKRNLFKLMSCPSGIELLFEQFPEDRDLMGAKADIVCIRKRYLTVVRKVLTLLIAIVWSW